MTQLGHVQMCIGARSCAFRRFPSSIKAARDERREVTDVAQCRWIHVDLIPATPDVSPGSRGLDSAQREYQAVGETRGPQGPLFVSGRHECLDLRPAAQPTTHLSATSETS